MRKRFEVKRADATCARMHTAGRQSRQRVVAVVVERLVVQRRILDGVGMSTAPTKIKMARIVNISIEFLKRKFFG